LNRLGLKVLQLSAVREEVLAKRWPKARESDPKIVDYVKPIIEDVKRRGDDALIEYTSKFDGVKLLPDQLRVDSEDIMRAYEEVREEQISAIEVSKERIERFQKEILSRLNFEYEVDGVRIRSCTRPIWRVGCYIPGGQTSYPSSLIMTVVPAKVAGVSEVAVCSPPRKNGEINPLVLVAADICGAKEVYRIGGVQAVAALAYGTETIKPVEKIVGPGSKYVVTAKMLVSKDLPVDLPAGPSEIIVFAEGSADPRIIALDLISQAEHIDGISILVSTSKKLAKSVLRELEHLISVSPPNLEVVAKNLSRSCLLLVSQNVDEAVNFINEFAPEHLELMVENASRVSEKIVSAALILIGKYTPVSASDYCLGTGHVLPTGGFSRVYSGLSVLDFVKRLDIVESSEEGLSKVRRHVEVLAQTEGLQNHAFAVSGRYENG